MLRPRVTVSDHLKDGKQRLRPGNGQAEAMLIRHLDIVRHQMIFVRSPSWAIMDFFHETKEGMGIFGQGSGCCEDSLFLRLTRQRLEHQGILELFRG